MVHMRKGKSARPRGRPPKTAAIRVARDLRARGRTLRQIADSDHLQCVLGTRVTGPGLHPHVIRKTITRQGVQSLLRQTPRERDRWLRDLDEVDGWCRGLESDEFSEFWEQTLFPLLLSHPGMVRGRSAQEEKFRGWIEEPGDQGAPTWVKTDSKSTWWARHRDLEANEERARVWSRREWRLAVREAIARDLWARRAGPIGRRLREVADRVGLSERQVRRLLMRRESSDEIARTLRVGRPRSEPGGIGDREPRSPPTQPFDLRGQDVAFIQRALDGQSHPWDQHDPSWCWWCEAYAVVRHLPHEIEWDA
jgi:hypothetical protein